MLEVIFVNNMHILPKKIDKIAKKFAFACLAIEKII